MDRFRVYMYMWSKLNTEPINIKDNQLSENCPLNLALPNSAWPIKPGHTYTYAWAGTPYMYTFVNINAYAQTHISVSIYSKDPLHGHEFKEPCMYVCMHTFTYTMHSYIGTPYIYMRRHKIIIRLETACSICCTEIKDGYCWYGWIHIQYSQPQSLRWRHNDHDSVSNHQPHGCLLNCLFRRRSQKTSKLRVTGLCVGNSPGPVNCPHKGPVTRKMFPFDDVIMIKYRDKNLWI